MTPSDPGTAAHPVDLLEARLRDVCLAVVDFEFTGLDANEDRICEVAVLRWRAGQVERTFTSLVKSDRRMSKGALRVTGITPQMLRSAPRFADIADELREVLAGAVLVAHNVDYDLGYLQREYELLGQRLDGVVAVDTLLIARRLFAFRKNNLDMVATELGVEHEHAHRAVGDARATLGVVLRMFELVDPNGDIVVRELLELVGALAPNSPLRLRQQRVLRDGFRERHTVWIDYQSTNDPLHGAVHREVGIWHLKLPYIQGWCYLRQGERVFRLDRIRAVQPGVRTYEIPEFKARI